MFTIWPHPSTRTHVPGVMKFTNLQFSVLQCKTILCWGSTVNLNMKPAGFVHQTSEEVRQEKISCMMYEETGGGYQQTLVSFF